MSLCGIYCFKLNYYLMYTVWWYKTIVAIYLCSHGLCCKVACFHTNIQPQKMVCNFPSIHLQWNDNVIVPSIFLYTQRNTEMEIKTYWHCCEHHIHLHAFQNLIHFIYHKILKISPGAYIFQRPFLRGLILEGLIYGGKFALQKRLG